MAAGPEDVGWFTLDEGSWLMRLQPDLAEPVVVAGATDGSQAWEALGHRVGGLVGRYGETVLTRSSFLTCGLRPTLRSVLATATDRQRSGQCQAGLGPPDRGPPSPDQTVGVSGQAIGPPTAK